MFMFFPARQQKWGLARPVATGRQQAAQKRLF
jgi:hypothetical protein